MDAPRREDDAPAYFYKFRSLDRRQLNQDAPPVKWVERIFTRNELYLASRREFNDPYDCCPAFRYEGTNGQILRRMRELANERPAANRATRRAETNRIVSNVRKRLKNPKLLNEARDGLFKQLQRDLDGVGILSLSAANDHVLMWSHYADYHKGICLRFKTNGSFGEAQRVRYVSERRPIDLLHGNRESLVDAVLNKAAFWNYEQEWRIVDPYNGPGSRLFAPDLLDAVIFGANIRDEDEAMVREWVAKRPAPMAFLRARMDEQQYRMKIVPIE